MAVIIGDDEKNVRGLHTLYPMTKIGYWQLCGLAIRRASGVGGKQKGAQPVEPVGALLD
ncbi:MAG: hypothetical protein H7A44_03140 [Opitutaceae bacterium]|nr:hypothetical protein [Opitutaceae bacterium]